MARELPGTAMYNVLLVIHILIVFALIAVILVQRSEGGVLGIGGGGLMTGRAAGNLLTRTTAILVACFFVTSLTLAIVGNRRAAPTSIMANPPAASLPVKPADVPSAPAGGMGAAPAIPAAPAVPPAAPAAPAGR